MNAKKAFTLVELIFVIVVLGILASIALPKFTSTVEDAYISKGQARVSTIRSELQNYRSKELLKGNGVSYPSSITVNTGTGAGTWSVSGNTYTYHIGSNDIVFNYDSTAGRFDCNTTATSPSTLCDYFK